MHHFVPLIFVGIVILDCTNQQTDTRSSRIPDKGTKVNIKNTEIMKLEINMIVSDAKAAAGYYQKVLNAEILSHTDHKAGMNETMMLLGGVEIRVLDENKDLGMHAPAQVGSQSVGINLFVDDIDAFFANAVNQGCTVLSPVQEFPEIPAKNAVFSDAFNHVWVVNQQY